MSTRERIMAQIGAMPEEDVIHMLRMWKTFTELEQERLQQQPGQTPSPWDVLRKYHKSVHAEDGFDCKTELTRYRDERYANPG